MSRGTPVWGCFEGKLRKPLFSLLNLVSIGGRPPLAPLLGYFWRVCLSLNEEFKRDKGGIISNSHLNRPSKGTAYSFYGVVKRWCPKELPCLQVTVFAGSCWEVLLCRGQPPVFEIGPGLSSLGDSLFNA